MSKVSHHLSESYLKKFEDTIFMYVLGFVCFSFPWTQLRTENWKFSSHNSKEEKIDERIHAQLSDESKDSKRRINEMNQNAQRRVASLTTVVERTIWARSRATSLRMATPCINAWESQVCCQQGGSPRWLPGSILLIWLASLPHTSTCVCPEAARSAKEECAPWGRRPWLQAAALPPKQACKSHEGMVYF